MHAPTEGQSRQSTASRETIAFLLDYSPTNWCSREDYHVGLCQALAAKGVGSVLVFSKALPAELESSFRQKGIESAVIDYQGKGVAYSVALDALAQGLPRFAYYYRELGKLVSKYSVTAVHISYFTYFSVVPWLARLLGVRSIVFEAVNGGVWRARSWKKKLLNLRTRLLTQPVKRVVAISAFVKEQLIQAGVPGNKIVVRHLGVDSKRYTPEPDAKLRLAERYAIRSEEIVLVTVSFLNPIKHTETILEACSLLVERGVRLRLLVAGDGPRRRELEALCQTIGIADRVHWLGHCDDPRQLLQGGDVFALASVGEAFGFVLCEAMACGIPVVATRSGGIVEVVEDGKTGLLVPPLDPGALADSIQQLLENPELRRSIVATGPNRVRAKFTVEATIENTIRMYESLGLIQTH